MPGRIVVGYDGREQARDALATRAGPVAPVLVVPRGADTADGWLSEVPTARPAIRT